MDKTEIRAVELVRSIRAQIYEETKGFSAEEFKEFIRCEAAKTVQGSGPGEHPSGRSAA